MSENSQHFNSSLFHRWLTGWKEDPRFDFKREVFSLVDKRGKPDEGKKFELVRDLIAFANVARRTGWPCWIVFGIEEGKRLKSVAGQYPYHLEGWHNPNKSFDELQTDEVEMQYRNLARDWIEPEPDIHLEYGWVDDVFVSYLQINPEYPAGPYHLNRNYIPSQGKPNYKGDLFVRRGSATVKVPREEANNLLPARKVAYLTRQDWQSIVERAKFESEAFAQQLITFPLHDEETGTPVFDVILESLKLRELVAALVGGAGEGKTTVMNALAWELARRVNTEGIRDYFGQYNGIPEDDTTYSVAEDLEVVPAALVPVKVELRKAFESMQMFEKEILKSMLGSVPDNKTLEHYWHIPGSRWVLLLDGMDEIVNFDEFAERLKTWLGQLPANVQVVLSSRPYAWNETTYKQIKIAKLNNNEQVEELIRQKLFSQMTEQAPAEWKAIKEFLLDEPAVFDVLRTPRAVDGFLEAWLERSTALFTESDKMPVPQAIAVGETDNPSGGQLAENGEVTISIGELTSEGEAGFVQTPAERTPDMPNEEIVGTNLPLPPAVYLQKVTVYLYGEEQKRPKKGRVDEVQDEREDAQRALQEVAWQKDWQVLTFDKDQMRKELRKWNEYIGFIQRTGQLREYRYLSMYFQSFCAAWFAFEFLTGEEENILTHINHRREIPATAQVVVFLNQLREANNRTPVTLSTGG